MLAENRTSECPSAYRVTDPSKPDMTVETIAASPPRAAPDAQTRHIDQLASEHYADLLGIARRELRRVGDDATLDTRAVIHEAFLRLVVQEQTSWADRAVFLAAASGMMRRVLLDHLRRRRSAKRGHASTPETLDDALAAGGDRDEHLIALDDALTDLARHAPRLARVVECRYFGGLTEVETAQALDVTERTVRRDWVKARGWLQSMLARTG